MAAIKRYTPFLVSSAVWRPFRLTESAIGRALDDDFGGLDYILPVLLVWVVGGMFINARTQARFKLSTQVPPSPPCLSAFGPRPSALTPTTLVTLGP